MALTKVSRGLLTTSIVDNGNATAITIDASENVGVGNTSPSSYFSNSRNLVVGGTTGANGMTISGSTDTQIFFADGTSGADAYRGIIRYSHADDGFSFWTNATRVLDIDSAGSVGIGTSTPDTTLHLQTPSGTKSEINFAQTAVTNYRIGVPASTDALVFTYGASTERIRLNSAGNVGINNPNPAQILSICNPANPNRNGMEIAIGAGDTSSNTIQNYNRATGAYTPLNIAGNILTFGVGTAATERMRIDSSGRVTMPYQPAFQAVAVTQVNIPINASTTINFTGQVFDQGSNYAGTSFTAPVTGKYQLNVIVYTQSVDSAADYVQIALVTSNRQYYAIFSTTSLDQDAAYMTFPISVLVDMDASDTAYVEVQLNNTGSSQMIVNANSHFSGYLVA